MTHCATKTVTTEPTERLPKSVEKPASGSSSRLSSWAGSRAGAFAVVRIRTTRIAGSATTTAVTA